MIKGKRLRPLAVVGDQPLNIEGVGTIPPITEFVKDFPPVTTAFGIFIPKGAPPEVIATVEKLWAERVAKSEKTAQVRQRQRRAVHAAVRQGRL